MVDLPELGVSLERVYVWEIPVRITHWVIFLAIVVLSATGYYIGSPFIGAAGAARDTFVMGAVRVVHLYAAIAFTLAVLVRTYWFIAGNQYARWSDFIPVTRRRIDSFVKTFLFYSFLSREPDEYPGHNALAAFSYAAIFGVYLVMIGTGFALYTVYSPLNSPVQLFRGLVQLLGGLPMTRLIHHVGMWIILIFVVVHIYFVMLSSLIEHVGIFDSIFSGLKYIPRKKADAS
jgi:Ni/Fe-hydrogenase 1 B-type cytochrome subunit